MSEWKEHKLGELSEVTSAKRIFYSEYVPVGIPFYRSKEIIDLYNNHEVSTELFISQNRYDEIESKYGVPQENDILLTSVGSLGIPYIVKRGDKFYFKDGNLTWIKSIDTRKLLPHYLKFWFISDSGKQKLDEITIGSTQPALTISGLKSLQIKLPSIDEQKRIVGVLSSLDDKIDLLNRENATLEALAETLFRHYFIENPNPDWKEGKLTDLIKIVGGGTPKTSEPSYWGGNIGWLSGGDIAAGHKCYVYHVEKYITQKGVNNSAVNIIPEDSMVISARGTVGKYCLLGKPMAFSQSNYGILPKINECYYFSYLLVSRYVEEMKNAAYGSVFDTITVKTFEGINVTIPNDKEIVVFNTMVKPIFEKIKSNQKQILALTSQRDTLLPRLMSGEVKVNK